MINTNDRRVDKNREDVNDNFFGNGVERTHIMMESLPLSIRMETAYNEFEMGQIVRVSQAHEQQAKDINLSKRITPMCKKVFVNLPFFVINMSISQLQMIMYLSEVWLLKGYDLVNALKESDSSQTLDSDLEDNISMNEENNMKRQCYRIENNIIYDERTLNQLREHTFFELDLHIEGLQVNFLLCSREVILKYKEKLPHQNELISLCIFNIRVISQQRYFETQQKVSIQTLLLQNKNCYNYDLLTLLKYQATHNLSKSDYQVLMKEECPLNSEVSHFQSINETNSFLPSNVNQNPNQVRNHYEEHLNKHNMSDNDLLEFIKDLDKKEHSDLQNKNNTGQNPNELTDQFAGKDSNDSKLKNKPNKSFLASKQNTNYMRKLIYFEEEQLLLNLKQNYQNHKEEHKDNQSKENESTLPFKKCEDCFCKDSKKHFLILNFQEKQHDKDYSIQEKNLSFFEENNNSSPISRNRSFQDNSFNLNDKGGEQNDLRIYFQSYEREFFVATEPALHETIPFLITVFLNNPIITIDPVCIAQIKNIFDSLNIYVKNRVSDFKEYMQSKGFSPYIEEEKVDQGQDSFNSENQDLGKINTILNSKIKSELILKTFSVTINMLHNVPNKVSNVKILEPVFLLNMSDIFLVLQITSAFTNLNLKSTDVCLFDISEKTGLHTQQLLLQNQGSDVSSLFFISIRTIGNILKPKEQQKKKNDLSIEMKIYHSKELSLVQKFSSFIGIRLREAKISFLKRNTMEVQIYIRSFLLDAFKNRVNVEDVRFIREYSRKLIAMRYDLFLSADREVVGSEGEKENVQPSNMKIEIVVLNSIACAYRNSLSENDGIFMRFSKLGFWFTGKWGQDFQQDGLIDTGKHSFENQISPNYDIKQTDNFQECNYNKHQINKQSPSQNDSIFSQDIPNPIIDMNEFEQSCQGNIQILPQNYAKEVSLQRNFKTTIYLIRKKLFQINIYKFLRQSIPPSCIKYSFQYNQDEDEEKIINDEFYDVISEMEQHEDQIFTKIQNQSKSSKPSKLFTTNEGEIPAKFINKVESEVGSNHSSVQQLDKNSQNIIHNETNSSKQENLPIIEIQRILLWGLEAFSSEEYQNRDLFISAPPNVPSVEVKIIFDDPDFQRYTFISDFESPPMKSNIEEE